MNARKRQLFVFACAVGLAVLMPRVAHAAGTGDDPSRTCDVVSGQEAKEKAADDASFASWKAKRASSGLGVQVIDSQVPYAYFWTPSHRQERPYWCGPAACQIITHYWGRLVPQWAFAQYMGTTTAGTDFSKIDDGLRYYSHKSYWYVGGVSDFWDFIGQCEYGMGEKGYPVVADVAIDGDAWPYYVYSHSGHILPVEGFDERVTPYRVRVNDPYDEAYFCGGGKTFGHLTYPAYVVARGVNSHWREAMVR